MQKAGNTKMYRISESELFNLESMREHLLCMADSMQHGDAEWDDSVFDRISEVESLLDKTHGVGSLVDWPTLKRIREIKEERQMIRYQRSLAAGYPESEAALAFTL